jgi:hypothetical protein
MKTDAETNDCPNATSLPTRHGRRGPLLSGRKPVADPIDPDAEYIGNHTDDPVSHSNFERIRDEQRIDLAMLRQIFRRLTRSAPDEESRAGGPSGEEAIAVEPGRNGKRKSARKSASGPGNSEAAAAFTCGEFNQLVSAVSRLHEAERNAEHEDPLQPPINPEQEEYDKLKGLSEEELRQYALRNGIILPDRLADGA